MQNKRGKESSEKQVAPVKVTKQNVGKIARKVPFQAAIVLRALVKMEYGSLTIHFPNGRGYHFNAPNSGPAGEVILHNWRLPRRAIAGGSIGVAESYMDGDWTSPDVTAFLELFCVNEQIGDDLTSPNRIWSAVAKFRHWLNENTRHGAKRNIGAHYDLGNRFYNKWLDTSITYSSALFERKEATLAEAQNAKYTALAQRTEINPDHSVLEIGCGWGGFAEFAAKEIGCQVTALTISQQQFDFASERIQKAGLNEKVDIKLQDYRDESGVYDRIASIEMFEAVGEKYWPIYFQRLSECLNPGGMAGLQIITIADKAFELYRRRPDFIQRYIFPGGMLPSPGALKQLASGAGLGLVHQRVFGGDYARTLEEWRHRFCDTWDDIRQMGFDERFRKLWEFYFHYCEAGFRSGNIDVRQLVYAKA